MTAKSHKPVISSGPELKAVIRDAEESSFRPESWYPPNASCFQEPHPQATIAHTPRQAKHLASSGWQSSADFFRPQFEREAIEESRRRAEAAEKAIEDERRASEVQAALEAEKAQRAKLTPAQVAETHQQFVIRVAQGQSAPLEERRKRINERFIAICDSFAQLRNSSAFDQLDGLAREWLMLREELVTIAEKLDAISDDLARQMANAN